MKKLTVLLSVVIAAFFPVVVHAAGSTALYVDSSTGTVLYPTTFVAGNKIGINVDSIASMVALTVSTLPTDKSGVINVAQYYVGGNGRGGGQFYYDSSSSSTANGGTIFAPNSGGGRFLRVGTGGGPLHTDWFGCKGDDTFVNNTTLQNAFTTTAGGWLFIDLGMYKITAQMNMPNSIHVSGLTMRSFETTSVGSSIDCQFAGPALYWSGGVSDIMLEHFGVHGNQGAYGAGNGIVFDGTGGTFGDGQLSNLVVDNFGTYGIAFTNGFYGVDLYNVYSAQNVVANYYLDGEYENLYGCRSDGAQFAVIIDSGAGGTNITDGVFEGATTAPIKIVSGATDVCIHGCRLNLTVDGSDGILDYANKSVFSSLKIFGGRNGVVLESTSAQTTLTGVKSIVNTGIALDDEGSGGTTISGGVYSSGGTAMKLNATTYSDDIAPAWIGGPTNSVLMLQGTTHFGGACDFNDGTGVVKAPTISGGTATGTGYSGTGLGLYQTSPSITSPALTTATNTGNFTVTAGSILASGATKSVELDDTGTSYSRLITTTNGGGAGTITGTEGASGAQICTGSSPYASVVTSIGAHKIQFGTNGAGVALSINGNANGQVQFPGYTSAGFLKTDSSGNISVDATAYGTVNSVAATVPSFLSISGTPVTTSGTLAIGLSGTALPTDNGGTGVTTLFGNIPSVSGIDSRTGLTSADGAPITLYTTVNGTSVLRITSDIFATAAVTGTAVYTITWTQNATTQTLVVNSTTINTLATATDLITPDNATAVTARLTGTFTGTFTVAGLVERIK